MRRSGLIALLLACASVAQGYYHFVRFPTRGQNTPVLQRFDLSALPAKTVSYYISDKGPEVLASGDTFTAVISQIRRAAKVWNDVETSDLRLAYGGLTSTGGTSATPSIDVVFDEVPPGLVALGGPTLRADVNSSAAVPFQPILKSVLILRKDLSGKASYTESFFLSLVHEFGHTLGLQHSLASSVMSTEITRATTKARPLSIDDTAGLSLLYPTKAFQANTGSISGRVTANDGSVHMASVVALTNTGQAISALTNPDGTYRIEGVPPGQYTIYVHALPPATSVESTPANIILPRDSDDKPIPGSAAFDLTFYPGTQDPGQTTPVTVTAANTTTGIDFNVQRRGRQSISAIQTYGFPTGANVAVKPPIFGLDNPRPFIILTGYGILQKNDPIPGLQATVLGEPSLIAGPLKASYAAGYLQLNLNLNSSLTEGQRHLIFQTSQDLYVLPSGFALVAKQPPFISSVTPGQDGQGNRTATIVGTSFNSGTRFEFDGVPVTASASDDSFSKWQITVPAGPAGYKAVVTALNPDGQSSLHLQSDNPPTYAYDNAAAAATPNVAISPATLPPGVETVLDVTLSGASLSDSSVFAFASPEVLVRRVVVTGANRALITVLVSGNAAPGSLNLTVANGLQNLTFSNALQISNSSKPFVPASDVTNALNGSLGLYAGATALVNLSSQPFPLTGNSAVSVTLGDRTVPASVVSDKQVQFTIPSGFPQGPALLKLQVGSETSLPILVTIASQPVSIISVQATNGFPINALRPARPGDTLTLLVTGLPDNATDKGRYVVTVGGIDHPATQVQGLGVQGMMSVSFVLSQQVSTTGPLTSTVQFDGHPSLPFFVVVSR